MLLVPSSDKIFLFCLRSSAISRVQTQTFDRALACLPSTVFNNMHAELEDKGLGNVIMKDTYGRVRLMSVAFYHKLNNDRRLKCNNF